MTGSIEQLIQARFDAVADHADGRDWGDVLGRAGSMAGRRRPPARVTVALAAAAVVAATTAAAFGWPGKVVDFFHAPPAPQSVEHFFATFHEAVPQGMNDGTLGPAHEVMAATFDADNLPPTNPTVHTLYVAPRTDGGFCFIWTDDGGSCADPAGASASNTDPAAGLLGTVWLANDYAGEVDGWIRGNAQSVEARFADGTSVTLPVTWVSAPIDAGFFVYVVPAEHLTTSDALLSVVALDASGNVVAKDDIGVTKPLDQDVLQTLPDGTKQMLPRRAQAAKATEPFSFRTASGAHAYLWVMPRTGGGVCFLYNTGAGGGGGCTAPRFLAQLPAINGGVNSDGSVYFAQVKPEVATVQLQFANGRTARLTPTDGFVLGEVDAGRAALTKAVALGRSGKAVATERFSPPTSRR